MEIMFTGEPPEATALAVGEQLAEDFASSYTPEEYEAKVLEVTLHPEDTPIVVAGEPAIHIATVVEDPTSRTPCTFQMCAMANGTIGYET